MATKIKLKKSGATGNVPTSGDLEYGELALNYADGVLYFKNSSNTIQQITSAQANSFETINANGSLIIADSNTDILTLSAGDALYINGNGINDTITIGVRTSDSITSNSNSTVATSNAVNVAYNIATLAYAKANAPITIREIYASNANVVNTFTNINTIQFDADSGMAVVDESNNTVTIQLNSTFKNWNVDGSPGLVAVGLDTVNFIAGSNMTISANNLSSPKSITFSSTGGGGGGGTTTANIQSDRFLGTGACTTYTLTHTSYTDATFVYIDGVSQKPQVDFQVSNKTLTFNVAPANNTTIEARGLRDLALVNVSTINSQTFSGNGACTEFALSGGTQYSTNGLFVFVDGVTQVPATDYSVTGTTLTFTSPPEASAVIEVRSVQNIQVGPQANGITSDNTTVIVTESAYSFYANGFTTSSDSINRNYILRGTTTNNVESEILLSGGTRIPVRTNTTVFYTADIVARRTDATGESAGFYVKGVVDNFSGTVADVGDLYEVVVAEDDANLLVDARADDTNNSINIYVTGANGKTIRWTALVRTVEVAQ